MAEQPVIQMQRRLEAGREYFDALKKLGFTPDALLWAHAGGSAHDAPMELVIVTAWVDTIGPKAIYDLLFEAYDASATPREIDPFIVSLFSPQTQVAKDIAAAVRTVQDHAHEHNFRPMLVLGMMDYVTIPSWILWYRPSKSKLFEDTRHFSAFKNNIERLAA